jgi:hypothetical protein
MHPAPDDDEERALARQWRLAQVNLAVACGMFGLALFWWFSDDATWQPPVYTVLAVGLVIAAVANVRQQQRNRRRRQERQDPR